MKNRLRLEFDSVIRCILSFGRIILFLIVMNCRWAEDRTSWADAAAAYGRRMIEEMSAYF